MIITANDEFCEITGYTHEELIGSKCHSLGWSDCQDMCRIIVEGDFNPRRKTQCTLITKNGQELTVLRNGSVIFDENGEMRGIVVSFVDITKINTAKEEAEKARDIAEHLAHTDYLTGLLNRRAFMKRLEEEFNRSIRQNRIFGLIMTDIDWFKKVNDTYGHVVGDIVLQEFANCLLNQSRDYDFIGRYGGEEFVVCLPDVTVEQAKIVAERMRRAVEENRIMLSNDQSSLNITASFGLVFLQRDTDNIDTLLSKADISMYKAKTNGRNNVYVDYKNL